MRKRFYLPGLNTNLQSNFIEKEEYESLIRTLEGGILHQFIFNSNIFYRENFGIDNHKEREKRLLDFETPNRAKITHEYDIMLPSNFDYFTIVYLFTPTSRLSWLKIRQSGQRILIPRKDKITSLVYNKLEQELISLIPNNKESFFNYIWARQKGYPCFIKFEDINSSSFLLEVEYYDSIVENTKKKRCNIFNPLEERVITYEYEPFANHSSWLYIRSPQNFNLSIDTSKIISDQYKIEHDNTSDPEIQSLTIVSYSDVNENVQFNIEITVPTSLKTWFLSIYSISFVVLIILGLHLLNKLWINTFGVLFPIGDIFGNIVNQSYFENIVLALVAGIIATRGWLISEETILKSYSKYVTYMMLLLLILFAISRITAFYT